MAPAAAHLQAAIVQDPTNPDLRLVYADALEEAGEGEAAQRQRQIAGIIRHWPTLAAGVKARDREAVQDTTAWLRGTLGVTVERIVMISMVAEMFKAEPSLRAFVQNVESLASAEEVRAAIE